jgi:hypothetical protein
MAGQSIVLDLKFRVVSPEQEAFIVFPGQNYALYPYFVTLSRIFPELPALDLVPKKRIAEQPDLDAKLRRSRAIDVWYSSGKKDDTRPSRKLSDYTNRRTPKWLPNTRGVLTGFFDRARKGDLVIVPPNSIFSRVLIGELLDDNLEEIMVPEVWEREKVPSRRVRWLATPLRGECSIELQRRFPSPNAVRMLDREARAEVYSMAYGSYSIEDSFTSKFDVTSADFSTRDDYHLQQFFNVVASICQQIEAKLQPHSATTDLGAKNLDEIIDLLTDDTYVPALSVNINSPGSLVLSCAKVVPLVAAGVLALSVLDADTTWQAVAGGKVIVQNSETPAKDDQCTAKVSAEVLEQLKLMGYERWQEVCKRAQQLQKDTGLKGKSKAEKK